MRRPIALFCVVITAASWFVAGRDAAACACTAGMATDPASADFAMSFIYGAFVLLGVPLTMIGGTWWYFRRQLRDGVAVSPPPDDRAV